VRAFPEALAMARFGFAPIRPAALAFFAALPFCALTGAAHAGAPVVSNGRVDCVEDTDKDDAGRAADEAACIALTDGAVRRDGAKLIVKRKSGEDIVFDSNPAACSADDAENCHVVSLHAYDPARGFALVEEGFYEALAMNLVDLASGDKIDLMARPEFSPSGKQLVSVIADLLNDPDEEILVYDLTATPFKRTFEAKRGTALKLARKKKDDIALFDFVAWDGEDRIKLKIVNDEAATFGTVNLERVKDKWTLKPFAKAK
jgi:hypothetical protein